MANNSAARLARKLVQERERKADFSPEQKQQYTEGQQSLNSAADNYAGVLKDRATRQENLENRSEFTRGVVGAIDQAQGMAYGFTGLAGDALGIDPVRDWGYEGYKRNEHEAALNPRTVPDLETAKETGKWGTYAAGTLGSLIPSVAEAGMSALAGGAIGGASTGGAGTVPGAAAGFLGKNFMKSYMRGAIKDGLRSATTKKLVGQEAKDYARDFAAKRMAQNIGAKAGMVGATTQMEAGSNWSEAADAVGVEEANPYTALGTGFVSGVAELAGGNVRIIDKVMGKKAGKSFVDAIKRKDVRKIAQIAAEAGKQMPAEAMQESFQELMSVSNMVLQDDSYEPTTEELGNRLANAAAAGAIGGGAFGGITGAFNGSGTAGKKPGSDGESYTPSADIAEEQDEFNLLNERVLSDEATDEDVARWNEIIGAEFFDASGRPKDIDREINLLEYDGDWLQPEEDTTGVDDLIAGVDGEPVATDSDEGMAIPFRAVQQIGQQEQPAQRPQLGDSIDLGQGEGVFAPEYEGEATPVQTEAPTKKVETPEPTLPEDSPLPDDFGVAKGPGKAVTKKVTRLLEESGGDIEAVNREYGSEKAKTHRYARALAKHITNNTAEIADAEQNIPAGRTQAAPGADVGVDETGGAGVGAQETGGRREASPATEATQAETPQEAEAAPEPQTVDHIPDATKMIETEQTSDQFTDSGNMVGSEMEQTTEPTPAPSGVNGAIEAGQSQRSESATPNVAPQQQDTTPVAPDESADMGQETQPRKPFKLGDFKLSRGPEGGHHNAETGISIHRDTDQFGAHQAYWFVEDAEGKTHEVSYALSTKKDAVDWVNENMDELTTNQEVEAKEEAQRQEKVKEKGQQRKERHKAYKESKEVDDYGLSPAQRTNAFAEVNDIVMEGRSIGSTNAEILEEIESIYDRDIPRDRFVRETAKKRLTAKFSSAEGEQVIEGEWVESTQTDEDVAVIDELRDLLSDEYADIDNPAVNKTIDAIEQVEAPSKSLDGVASALNELFGVRVVYLRGLSELANAGINYSSSYGNIIAVDVGFGNPSTARVVAHELAHALQRNNPNLYKQFKGVIAKEMQGITEYQNSINATRVAEGQAELRIADITDEMIADFLGNRAAEQSFWTKAAEKSGENKQLIDYVAAKFQQIIGKIKRFLTKDNKDFADLYISDIERAETVLADYVGTMSDIKVEDVDAADRIRFSIETRFRKAVEDNPDSNVAKADNLWDKWQAYVHSNIIDRMDGFINGLGDLPQKKRFKVMRQQSLGALAKIDEDAKMVYDVLSKAGEHSDAIYDYLTTKGASPRNIPTEYRSAAIKAKERIIQNGKEMVDRKLMSVETWERRKGEYLPRVYLRFLLGDKMEGMGQSKSMDLKSLMQRKDIPEDVRRYYLGEVKDPAYLAAQSMMKQGRNLVLFDMLQTIANNPHWSMPNMLLKWTIDKGEPITRFKNVKYRERKDGKYDVWVIKHKTNRNTVKKVKKEDVSKHVDDVSAKMIKDGKGKGYAYRVKGEMVASPWLNVGEGIKYKQNKDGTYDIEIKTRTESTEEHLNQSEMDLFGLLPEKTASAISDGKGKVQEGATMTPFSMLEEVEKQRKIAEHMPPEDAKVLLDIAEKMEKKANKALDKLSEKYGVNFRDGKVPEGWRMMPKTESYGALRGMVVRKEIYDDIVGNRHFSDKSELDAVSKFLTSPDGFMSRAHKMFKWSRTAGNLPTHMRNLYSNMFLVNMAGVPAHKIPKLMMQSLGEVIKYHKANSRGDSSTSPAEYKYYQHALDNGLSKSTYSAEELHRMDRMWRNMQRRTSAEEHSIKKLGLFGLEKFAGLYNALSDMYQLSETVSKVAVMRYMMENKNLSAADAAYIAHDSLFDYSLVAPWIKTLRSFPIVGSPFVTFAAKILPRTIEVALTKPWLMASYAGVHALLATYLYNMLGFDDEDDRDALRKAAPAWMHGEQAMYPLPTRDEHGRVRMVDAGYIFPWNIWTEALFGGPQEILNGNVTEGFTRMMSPMAIGGVGTDIITALTTGKDAFTGKDIVPSTAVTPGEKMAARAKYWTMYALPPFLNDRGVVASAFKGDETDIYGNPAMSKTKFILKALAINMYEFDPQQSRALNLIIMRSEMNDIMWEYQKKLSHQTDPAKQEEIIKEAEKNITYLAQKMTDYAEESDFIDPEKDPRKVAESQEKYFSY